jgi:peptide-methionine (R)-S-oxide reductase
MRPIVLLSCNPLAVFLHLLLFLTVVLLHLPDQAVGFLPSNIPSTTVISTHDGPSLQRCVSKKERQTQGTRMMIRTGAMTTSLLRCDALPVERTDEEWKQLLTDEQYYVLRKEGTETPGASELNYIKESGTFCCAGCGAPLFITDDKFDSGTGWPSFTKPVSSSVISHTTDFKLVVPRTECSCSQCGGHLGHVFGGMCANCYCLRGVDAAFLFWVRRILHFCHHDSFIMVRLFEVSDQNCIFSLTLSCFLLEGRWPRTDRTTILHERSGYDILSRHRTT